MHVDHGQDESWLIGQVYRYNYDISYLRHYTRFCLVRCCQFNFYLSSGAFKATLLVLHAPLRCQAMHPDLDYNYSETTAHTVSSAAVFSRLLFMGIVEVGWLTNLGYSSCTSLIEIAVDLKAGYFVKSLVAFVKDEPSWSVMHLWVT